MTAAEAMERLDALVAEQSPLNQYTTAKALYEASLAGLIRPALPATFLYGWVIKWAMLPGTRGQKFAVPVSRRLSDCPGSASGRAIPPSGGQPRRADGAVLCPTMDAREDEDTCPTCHGFGELDDGPGVNVRRCPTCRGRGVVKKDKPQTEPESEP